MLNILAVDQSLTRTGFCLPDGTTTPLSAKAPPNLVGMVSERDRYARQCLIRDRMLDLADRTAADLIVIEGYAYAQPNAAAAAGEMGFALRDGAARAEIPWVIVPPNSRAKYATGNGSASKDDVLQATAARLGRTFPNSDECDAWLLAALTSAAYGLPRWEVPKKHQDALPGVDWPTVTIKSGPFTGLICNPVSTYAPKKK